MSVLVHVVAMVKTMDGEPIIEVSAVDTVISPANNLEAQVAMANAALGRLSDSVGEQLQERMGDWLRAAEQG